MADLRAFSSTSNLIRFSLKNSSTGVGLTGLTNSSAGLIVSTIADNEASATAYTQSGGTIQTIATLGTFAAPSASNCRFKEIDSTNHPGLYEFQFLDARFSVSNSKRLVISVSGAASLLGTDYEIELVQFNPFDSVRLGLTALPNTAVTTNGSLITSGTGTDQLSVMSGRIDVGKFLGTTSVGAAGYAAIDWSQIANPTATVGLTNTTISSSQVTASVTNVNAIADGLLKRDMSLVSGEANYSPLNAFRFIRNKFSVVGTTLTVYKEDGSTSAWTGIVTTNAGALPITANTPS